MSQSTRQMGSPAGDEFLMLAVITACAIAIAGWLGAQTAALLHAGAPMPASPSDGFRVMVRLPAAVGDPLSAWGPEAAASLPGPILYWSATASVALVSVGLVVGGYLRFASIRVGTDRKDRLGVAPQARLARRRDLRPLIVSRPLEGRFVMG